jgi:hypothetical protein
MEGQTLTHPSTPPPSDSPLTLMFLGQYVSAFDARNNRISRGEDGADTRTMGQVWSFAGTANNLYPTTGRAGWYSLLGTLLSARFAHGEQELRSEPFYVYPLPASPAAFLQYAIVSSLIAGSGLFRSPS